MKHLIVRRKSLVAILKVTDEKRYESADPDPYQNVTDPQQTLTNFTKVPI